jgi:TDG/mug DNA glycosylase family protein
MDKPLADVIAPGLGVLFCGLNPGRQAAAEGHHFAGRGNRFWRVLHLAGFTPRQLSPEEDRQLLDYGCGLTTVVARATAGAADLERQDYISASGDLVQLIERFRPRHVAFLGKAAYAAIQGDRQLAWGRQPTPFGGITAWLLPNPSGRNLSFQLEDLVTAYRDLRSSDDARA